MYFQGFLFPPFSLFLPFVSAVFYVWLLINRWIHPSRPSSTHLPYGSPGSQSTVCNNGAPKRIVAPCLPLRPLSPGIIRYSVTDSTNPARRIKRQLLWNFPTACDTGQYYFPFFELYFNLKNFNSFRCYTPFSLLLLATLVCNILNFVTSFFAFWLPVL